MSTNNQRPYPGKVPEQAEGVGVNTIPLSKTVTYDPGDGGAPFRCGVGLVVINQDGHCLAFERRLTPGEWQWPQGGIDRGEEPEAAAYRELNEEAGILPDHVELLVRLPEPTFYLFPDYIEGVHPTEGIKYRGQRHDWFVFLFKGDTENLKYDLTDEVEFGAHRWTPLHEMPNAIVGFKRDVYQNVVKQLTPHIEGWRAAWQGR